MSINHLIGIGLYISGIVVFAVYMYRDFQEIIDTDVKEEFANLAIPDALWPIIVGVMAIIYIVLSCIWPYWIIADLWKNVKAALKKS